MIVPADIWILTVRIATLNQGPGDTSGLLLEYWRPFGMEVGECKPPVAAGAGAGELDYDIVPGDAALLSWTSVWTQMKMRYACPKLAAV